jgi:streptomycin 6-kinase
MRGGMSVVVPVRPSDGSQLMLKLLDLDGATREALALRAFPPSASVRCIDHAVDLGALLLERLTPVSLAGAPVDEQIIVQARLARSLAVPAPWQIGRLSGTRLADHLNDLLCGAPDLLDGRVIDAARESLLDVASDDTATLTHGDLHTINVHKDDSGHWRVLDPNPHVGTIAFESHTVIVERSRLDEVIRAGGRELRRRLALFADVAEVDQGSAERFCQSRAVMSAPHEQARGAFRLAGDLRWMAEALTPPASVGSRR